MTWFDITTSCIMTTISTFLRTLLINRMSSSLPYQFETALLPHSTYDFVVVGSGCAGSVMGARLAETGASVLVLEAGGDIPPESAVPGLAWVLFFNEKNNWRFKAKEQPDVMLGFLDQSKLLIQGKSMGGNSALNGLVHIRGNPKDFDHWASLGNEGWDYNSVLPYFKMSENYQNYDKSNKKYYHGRRGPLYVVRRIPTAKIISAFLNAGKELGFDTIDPSADEQIGFTPTFVNIKNGVRHSASESYLRPVMHRINLDVVPLATARRVLFNGHKRASGVEYVYNGKIHIARVRMEVIVSAGALNTPKLLMMSGIGPEKLLRKIGITKVSVSEGVGQNLQNHPIVPIPFKVRDETTNEVRRIVTLSGVSNYLRTKKGPLSYGFSEAFCFQSLMAEREPWTDVMMELTSLSFIDIGTADLVEGVVGKKTKNFEDLYSPLGFSEMFSLHVTLARPKSNGSVVITSSEYWKPPLVDNNILHHPDDELLMIKGIRAAFRIINTKSMQNTLAPEYVSKPLRWCSHHAADSDDYWGCHIRHEATQGLHFAGTAKMGPKSDPLAVVSPRLSVHGVTGLRVIDASVMPAIVASEPMATVYMIAEKGAEFIKQDWGYRRRIYL